MRFMSTIFLGSLLVANLAYAEPAIRLDQQKIQPTNSTKSISGKCGTTEILISDVTNILDGFFQVGPAPKIVMKAADGKSTQLGQGVLSDYNGIACVSTKKGVRLLIWSNCGGSACGDNFNFFIADPERLAMLAPKNIQKNLCDETCASKVLGNRLPQKINGGR